MGAGLAAVFPPSTTENLSALQAGMRTDCATLRRRKLSHLLQVVSKHTVTFVYETHATEADVAFLLHRYSRLYEIHFSAFTGPSGEILYTTGGVLTFVHKLNTSSWSTDIEEVNAGRCTRVELFREKHAQHQSFKSHGVHDHGFTSRQNEQSMRLDCL